MDVQQIALPALVFLAVGGGLYVVASPFLSGSSQAQKRKAALQTRATTRAGAGRASDVAKRRKAVSDSLRELDQRTKSKTLTFETRMQQGGLDWSKAKFSIVSATLGLVAAAVALGLGAALWTVGAVAVVGGFGVPRWYVARRRKRRFSDFLDEFPGAIDIIVRGIRAGIPLSDCIRNIATESPEPVRTEFRAIVEAQSMGLSIADACERLIERVPLPEANFFAIVINIQSKAGGNLAEALTNLSTVLRDRKKMKGKVKAMSSEAKASAGIIGALPPLVAMLVWMTSPSYIALLFTTSPGHMVLAASALWMSTGIFVMKKMISFEM